MCWIDDAYMDPETALIYETNRYYDPATAQFLTRDPLDALTQSAYGYVGDNPLNGTDPTGLFHIPGTNSCFHIPGTHDGCNAPGPKELLTVNGAKQALSTASTVFASGALAADITGVGAPVGVVLGGVSALFSTGEAITQCAQTGFTKACWVALAAAGVNVDSFGLAATAPGLQNVLAARLVSLFGALIGQLTTFLNQNLKGLAAGSSTAPCPGSTS
jgi:RHS repeat-associated protein